MHTLIHDKEKHINYNISDTKVCSSTTQTFTHNVVVRTNAFEQ